MLFRGVAPLEVEPTIGIAAESGFEAHSLPLFTENSLQVSETNVIQGLEPCRGVWRKEVDPNTLASKVQNQVVLEIGEIQ